MRKLSLVFVATSMVLATAPVMLPAPAIAAANPNVALCREIIAEPAYSELSLGECVSLLTVEDNIFDNGTGSGHAAAVLGCKLLPQYDPAFYATFASNKECIEYFETFY